jgi:hypothetical protein
MYRLLSPAACVQLHLYCDEIRSGVVDGEWCIPRTPSLSNLCQDTLADSRTAPGADSAVPKTRHALTQAACSRLLAFAFFRIEYLCAGRANPRVAGLIDADTSDEAAAARYRDATAVAAVDGCNAQGAVVGKFCMDLAVQKAKRHGVGIVVARNSNHYGIAGFYTEAVAREHGACLRACVRAFVPVEEAGVYEL